MPHFNAEAKIFTRLVENCRRDRLLQDRGIRQGLESLPR
ncbi:hypothetical protein DFAR_3210005 [Desulfarculales bacterium]